MVAAFAVNVGNGRGLYRDLLLCVAFTLRGRGVAQIHANINIKAVVIELNRPACHFSAGGGVRNSEMINSVVVVVFCPQIAVARALDRSEQRVQKFLRVSNTVLTIIGIHASISLHL